MEFLIKFTEIMLSNFWYFIGCFLVLALLLEVFEKVACKFFDFLISLVKRRKSPLPLMIVIMKSWTAMEMF